MRPLSGLGYALLLQGKSDEALQVFNQIKQDSLRLEGLSAVAYDRDGANARAKLKTP